MKTSKIKQIFSVPYIHVYFSEQTPAHSWWLTELGEDFWSGAYTFDCDSMFLMTEGEYYLTLRGKCRCVRPGQLCYIPAGTSLERHIKKTGSVRFYYTHFDLLFGSQPLSSHFSIPTVTTLTDTTEATSLFEVLKECYRNPTSPESVFRANGALLQLIALLLKESGATLNPTEEDAPNSMQAVIRHIHTNLNRTITVAELAEIADYSPKYFSKIFRQCFNLPPQEYITKIKINQAKKRMRETRLSVAVIAEELGYCDANYFAKIFKRKTGVSPIQYRKTARHRI